MCRQLGYVGGALKITKKSYFGRVNEVFAMDNVNCSGKETQILDCGYQIEDDCTHGEAAGVVCRGNKKLFVDALIC